MEPTSPPPSVAVLLPVLDEAPHIEDVLASLVDQDYEGDLVVVVAEGGSTDGTADIVGRWATDRPDRVVVVANPDRVQSKGLNRAAAAVDAEVLVRADGHSVYPADYVRRSVDTLLRTGAMAAGGPMRPEGRSPFGRAVAAAMRSKLGVGPGRFHHDVAGPADTVYLGAFRRADLARLGGFRTFPSGVGEDADLYQRMREAGGTVWIDPGIRTVYRPRETPRALARQFYRYGLGKAEMLYVNGRWPSWRPLAPLLLVAALTVGLLAWLLGGDVRPLAIVAAAWGAALAVAALHAPGSGLAHRLRTMAAAAIMHLAYGAGLWWGLLRGPGPVAGLRRRPAASGPSDGPAPPAA